MPIGRPRPHAALLEKVIGKELDRRRPITSPTSFISDSARPDPTKNKRRVIFVRRADGTYQGQYSDGVNWQTFLATGISYATPTFTYGTTATGGSASTTIRSDARLLFPSALMATTSTQTFTLTDNGADQTLTSTLGDLYLIPPSSRGFFIGDGVSPGAPITISARFAPSSGASTAGLQTQYLAANISGHTLRAWNVAMAHAAQVVSSSIIGYDMGTFTITPSAGSDTANTSYGAKLQGPLIANATGGFSEVAGLHITAPRRIVSNPTVTAAYGGIIECPTVSATTQAGIYIKQRVAQQTATNRYGILIDTHNSGTNRWGLQCAEKIENAATDMICSASSKGIIGQYSDQAGRYFRLRALYAGGSPALTIDDIGTTLPTT